MSFGVSEEVIKKACELSMKAHECCDESNQYIYDECQLNSMGAAVFSFAGAWSVSDLFAGNCSNYGETKIDIDLFPSLKSIGSQEAALVNEAFLFRFKAIFENSSLAVEVDEAVKVGKQVVFAGQGLGGPMAIFATLWFLEKYTRIDCIATPRCVTFGSPLVGNRIFPHAIRRENWSQYFIHLVIRHDIVPCIMFAPYFSVEKELQKVLDFLNPKSVLYKHSSICMSSEASSFVENVLTNLSSVASYVACNLAGCKNLLVDNFSNFMELSPYRPFGTYIFCINDRTVVVRNSDAVLQLLFHSSQLQFRDEGARIAGQILRESLVYNDMLQKSIMEERFSYLDDVSVKVMKTKLMTLDDLALSLRAKLSLLSAVEFEEQKLSNEKKLDREEIIAKLDLLQEYCRNCEARKECYYDAFKIKENEDDFHAGVAGLQLGGMWNEILEMLKMNQLPDEFEGNKEWIELGTKYRRLDEPIAIGSYYVRGLNDDSGPFMIKGRSNIFKFTQRWLEHDKKLPVEIISESCFWAEVEELMIFGKKKTYDGLKERIISLEKRILHWHEAGVLEKGVFFDRSTFTKWWNSLPQQHKSQSCIRGLFRMKIRELSVNI